MQVIRGIENIPYIENAVVTNGTFDGTHIGHDKILNQLIEATKKVKGKSVVLTYWPHPRLVLGNVNSDFKLLYTIEERIELLKNYAIDYLIIIEFTKSFSQLSSEDFIKRILIEKLNTKKLILGYNHRFGKNREGSFEYLKENASKFGFEIEEISKQVVDEEGISSTKIRKALLSGDIDTANQYLNKNFFIDGVVVKGNQLGRKIGFPTANIELNSEYKIIPKDGVYAVNVIYDCTSYKGMLNIGYKPTIKDNKHSIEVNIFNFDKEIYNENIKIEFIKRIRDEQNFDSLEDLRTQLSLDKQKVLSIE